MKLTLLISALFLLVSFILLVFNQYSSAGSTFMISMYALYSTILNVIETIKEKEE